jgi:hypothetical protein
MKRSISNKWQRHTRCSLEEQRQAVTLAINIAGEEKMFSSSMYLRNLRSFVRRSAGPLLGIWVLVYALERSTLEYLLRSRENVSGIWQLLVSWQANELDLLAFLTLIAVVSLTWAFRMALYRPSLLVMRGRGEQTAGDIIASAMERIPRVFAVQLVMGLIFFATIILCFICNPPIFFFVEFPLAVAFSPVMYLVVARDYSIKRALKGALRMWRRRWMLMFAVQGVLTLMTVAVSQAIQQSPDHQMRAMMLLLGLQYARWVGEMALFLTLDPRRKCE